MSEDAKFLTAWCLGILIVVLSVAMGISYVDHRSCDKVEKFGTVTTEWHGMVDGCYVTENGETFPIDKWRAVPS